MARNFNTNKDGGSWDDATIQAVWEKARLVPNGASSGNGGFKGGLGGGGGFGGGGAGFWGEYFPSDVLRQDICSTLIERKEYGNRNSKTGWEIDHIKPIDKGGTDDISNLQPLHWENNAAKYNTYPWDCSMKNK